MVEINEFDTNEARKEGFTYTEKEVKGEIDRVTIELKGRDAASFSKLADSFRRIKELTEQLGEEKAALNEKVKGKIDDLFDATDIVYTRVVQTAKLAATMSKKAEAQTEFFDKDAYIAELEGMLPELESKLKRLRKKYTKVTTIQKSPGLRIKLKDHIEEDSELDTFFDKLTTFAASIKEQVSSWASTYDQKLEHLRSHLPVTETLGGQAVGFGRKGRNAGSRKQDLMTHIRMTRSGLGHSLAAIRADDKDLSKQPVEELEQMFKDLKAELEASKLDEDSREKEYDMQAIGAEAFRNGRKRIPSLDPRLMAAIANMEVGGSHDYLKAWLIGWDRENLKD